MNPSHKPSSETLDLARHNVRELLLQSEGFRALPPDQQREIANHTVQVASYLAEPDGIRANQLSTGQAADPYAIGLDENQDFNRGQFSSNVENVNEIGSGKFKAQAAREGAAVAGALLKQVNFPTFVAGLIKGVFHAIVESSIEQMEAYGKLVADVAKSLNQFRDENVSSNQGRDHLVEMFPDTFMIGEEPDENGNPSPKVKLRDGVDEDAALKKVNTLPIEGGAVSSLDDEAIEEKLVPAARTQLATSRQQLLATMVLMGINRIVVTDGKISAKVLYDFQARDNRKMQRSAVAYDYARDAQGNLATTWAGEGEYESQSEGGSRTRSRSSEGDSDSEDRDASYYAKGKYKYSQQPVVAAMSAASESTDAALQTKASLAGIVEVNFKSDYFPLEKMADSFQIGMIQNAAQPGTTQGVRGAGTPAATSPTPSTQSPTQQPPRTTT